MRVGCGVLGVVRADDAVPAFGVGLGEQQPALLYPLQHGVEAVIFNSDAVSICRVNLARRDAAGCNDLRYGKLTLGVELGEHGGEVVAETLDTVMCTAPDWAKKFPLKTGIKIISRYGK